MLQAVRGYNDLIMVLNLLHHATTNTNSHLRLQILSTMGGLVWRQSLVWQTMLQRRRHSVTACKFKNLNSCNDEEFREMFRFRKREFMMIMHHLNLLMPDGSPTTLRVGRPGHKAVVPGDYCLMVCLARLSYPLRYVDLAKRLGGSRTICCDAFLYMVRSIDELFGHVVLDIDRWLESDNVMDCCDIMAAADHRLRHVLGFLDTTFQPCARPGGDGCVFDNMDQSDLYSGYKKQHGIKWQVLVFANGLSCTSRENPGRHSDAHVLAESNWLPLLQTVSDVLGFDVCVVCDGQYSRGPNIVRRDKRHERDLPVEMSQLLNQWRILVENDFAAVHNNWQFLTHKQKIVVGTSPFARIWRVSILFHNLQTLSYGNQVTARLGYHLHHMTYATYLA
jgi:hypothetical protein